MIKTVLIAGAGIAGLTMAYWLNRYGYNVTVVEIAAGLRKGGAAIDVRGEALHVAERMGILGQIKAKKISTAVAFVDAENNRTATLKNFGEDASGRDIELHRDHLAQIIYEAANKGIEYVFNNRIKTIQQENNKAAVIFGNEETRNFDFVFGQCNSNSRQYRQCYFGLH